jgi:hypothetical protein
VIKLNTERKEQLKSLFTEDRILTNYHPKHREISIMLTEQDLRDISDFYQFKQTREYIDWLKYARRL